jgi:hypothetical protein
VKRDEIAAASVTELVMALRTATPAAYGRIEDEILKRLDKAEKLLALVAVRVDDLGNLFLPIEDE